MIINREHTMRMFYQLIRGQDAVIRRGDYVVVGRWKHRDCEAVNRWVQILQQTEHVGPHTYETCILISEKYQQEVSTGTD